MGMSFDKAVDRLEDLHFEQDDWEYEKLTEDCLLNKEALRLAIETMRKYQRIEQIVNGNINGVYSNIAEIRRIINGDNNTDGKKLC